MRQALRPPSAEPAIQVRGRVSRDEAAAVARLAAAAAGADGVAPLSEQVRLHLRYGGDDRARNFLLQEAGELAGYAHLGHPDDAGARSGELVVGPGHRRKGNGLRLARALLAEAGGGEVRLWAHGDLPAAGRLAAAAGFTRARALWQMRRPLTGQLPPPSPLPGITMRTFVTGQDEDEWVALNRRAFAGHPEQGSWTREDLDRREREPWFDPDGFFLAERDGRLAGFHWTKIHPAAAAEQAGPGGSAGQAAGEVYVVGVDPAERGTGLGRALTLTGLRYLRERGLAEVMLYVDESNAAAIRLYESLGFARASTDVMYTSQPGGRPAGGRD